MGVAQWGLRKAEHTVHGIPKKTTLLSGDYLRNRSTLDIGVLGYIGIGTPSRSFVHSSWDTLYIHIYILLYYTYIVYITYELFT